MSEPHIRRQIRDNRCAVLKGLPLTGDRVKVGQTRPLPDVHEPTLLLFTMEVRSGHALDGNPGGFGRFIDLYIDIRVSTTEPSDEAPEQIPDNLLDTIASQVEARMDADRTFGGLVFDSELVGSPAMVKAEGDRHKGALRMQYRCRTGESGPGDED